MIADSGHADDPVARELWLARLAAGRPGRLTVLTGSMAPLLRPGETIEVVAPPPRLLPGDLVVFTAEGQLVCHRLMLPLGRGLWLQKGDLNPTWQTVRRRHIVGRPVAVTCAGRRHPLDGPGHLRRQAAVWLLVALRDLARLGGRLLPPAGRWAERLLSGWITGIVAGIRPAGGADASDHR